MPKLVTTKDQWVYDAVYTPAKTDFLKRAESNKSKIIYGIDLFLFQGIEAFILFTDQEKLRKTIYKKVKEKLQLNKQIVIDSIENYKRNRAKRSLEISKEERRNDKLDSIKMKRSRMLLKTND